MLHVVILSCLLWCTASTSANLTCEYIADALEVYIKSVKCEIDGNVLTIANENPYRRTLHKLSNVEDITILKIDSFINHLPGDAFENFHALKNMELTGNDFTEVPIGTFANLRQLNHLTIERNELESMAALAQLPPNLLRLYVSDNKLRRLTGLASHSRLQTFHLANNRLLSFVMDVPTVMPNLERLDLHGNRIKEYYTPLLSNLHELKLNMNALTQVPTDMFKGLKGLFDLDLSGNFIATIDPGAFVHTPALTFLNLANNSLRVLDADVFVRGGSKVTSLRLKHNRLQFLSLRLLARMPRLEDISLHKNPWNCGCLDDLLNWIEEFQIHVWCRAHSFNGTVPVCVVHSGEKNICPYRYFEYDTSYFMEHRSGVISVDSHCPNIS